MIVKKEPALESEHLSTGAIAMAVYRPQPGLFRQQIESIQRQTYTSWVCHIVIDGHDDDTASFVGAVVGDDSRFVVHHCADNVGFYRNFERAISLAGKNADWVALADQDDRWDAHKLERLARELQPGVTGVMCQARVVSADGQALGATQRRVPHVDSLLLDNQVTGSLALFTQDVVAAALPFPQPTSAAYHDHWLGLVAVVLGRFVVVNDEMQSYVQHGANVLGEDGQATLSARIGRLGGWKTLDTLAIERWGWRRTVAVELNRRFGHGPGTVAHELARKTTGPRVGMLILKAIGAREIHPARAVGLATGWMITALRVTPAVRRAKRESRAQGSPESLSQ